jgi:transcription termination/antitermination protein NusA
MSELSSAIRAVCEEKGLSYESVVETIETALAAAYRKDFGQKNQNIKVKFNPETGDSKIYDSKTVVADLPEDYFDEEGKVSEKYRPKKTEEEGAAVEISPEANVSLSDEAKIKIAAAPAPAFTGEEGGEYEEGEDENVIKFNPKTEIQYKDATMIKSDAMLGEELITELAAPKEYGRMAAQTAKQVVIQKLREAEREMIMTEFKDKEREVVTGVVQRREGRNVLVDLGRGVGRLPMEEQIYGERYNPGDKVKVYVKEVRSGNRGPEIILSRTSEEIVKKVFFNEIPEIANGILEIKAVAREAGSRAKVAIWTDAENVDPIGSCVGQRGSRIQTIISELGGERVDMVKYDEDPAKFVANSLSPAKVLSVQLNEAEKRALVKVIGDQLSLAIGKRGQNVRLAARLTGWKIDIIEEGDGTSTKLSSEEDENNEGAKKDEAAKEDESSFAETSEDKALLAEKLAGEKTPVEVAADKVEEILAEEDEKKAKEKKPKKEKKAKKTKTKKEE